MPVTLPIDDALPDLCSALDGAGVAVLQAPPGAGKTTRVPPCLSRQYPDGRIIMLEPRRVAARTAAERMASELGEAVGQTVGYRMRGETRTGPATRIEVVTEGILTRMIQSDPGLSGVACVVFDEFHERSLHADLGLALALEVRAALRPDLALVVMSATLNAQDVAELMDDAPVITSQGRMYSVETHWLDRSWKSGPQKRGAFEAAATALIADAAAFGEGSILVFLPGAGEIERVAVSLKNRAIPDADIVPLYGALPFKAQMAALRPADPGRRKIVLATSIAETSLTIPDVRIVVDCGLTRRPRFDPGSGMTRLVTERVTKAEADQRRGRAGRVAAGHCFRMWTKGEEGGLRAFPPVQIEDDDLAALALELAVWGARDPDDLAFLTPPPRKALGNARALLIAMGALKDDLCVTDHGRALGKLPLHPRLAHMLLRARKLKAETTAATIAAILSTGMRAERGDTRLGPLMEAAAKGRDASIKPVTAEIRRLEPKPDVTSHDPGALLSLAYPDRIAQRRKGKEPRYLLAAGNGARLTNDDPMADEPWLVIADLDGDRREAEIRLAAPVSLADIRSLHAGAIIEVEVCDWDARKSAVVAERRLCLGAIVIQSEKSPNPDPDRVRQAMMTGIRSLGMDALPWTKLARLLQARVSWARRNGADNLPDLSDVSLADTLDDWLAPYLGSVDTLSKLASIPLGEALNAALGWDNAQTLNRLAPQKYQAPTGTGVAIDYGADTPKISVRLQEMLGVRMHPTVGPQATPLLIELLSPAHRPIQTTADLPGFWASSYADVRKDLRGRYPRHVWPEDPARAQPTRRAKPRGS